MADSVPDPSKSPSAECDGSVESNVADRNLSIIRASKWDFFYSLRFFVSNLDTSIRNLTVSTPLYSSVPPANKSKGCIHYLESHFFLPSFHFRLLIVWQPAIPFFLSLSLSSTYYIYFFFLIFTPPLAPANTIKVAQKMFRWIWFQDGCGFCQPQFKIGTHAFDTTIHWARSWSIGIE